MSPSPHLAMISPLALATTAAPKCTLSTSVPRHASTILTYDTDSPSLYDVAERTSSLIESQRLKSRSNASSRRAVSFPPEAPIPRQAQDSMPSKIIAGARLAVDIG